MPKTNYNDLSFWQQNYKKTCCEHYEWLCKPQTIFTSLSQHLNYSNMSQILEIGCGTSSLSNKLKQEVQFKNFQTEITCADFSKELIKKLRTTKRIDGVNYVCADVRDLTVLPLQEYDYIFDKGCFDCLFCHDNFIREVIVGARECYRVLKPGGKLIVISHGKQKNRTYLFRNKLIPFKVTRVVYVKTNHQPQVNFYICEKLEDQEKADEELSQGHVDSQHQNQDEEQAQEQKNKKQDVQKQQGNNDANFILEEPRDKKGNNKGQETGGDFILAEDSNEQKEDEEGGDFILKEAQYENQQFE